MSTKPPQMMPTSQPAATPSGSSSAENSDALAAGFPELVIAFVAPLGANLTISENAVATRLNELGYSTERVRITDDVLAKIDPKRGAKLFSDQYTRVSTMMDIGTDAREKFGEDILALGAAAEIARKRSPSAKTRPKTAYLVHSLKHPEEVRRFREIYPRGFYLIAVNVPPDTRKKHLIEKREMTPQQAEALMLRDKKEDVTHGQQVNATFHLADFFVGWAEDQERIEESVRRFVDIIFGDPHRTPTFGEYSMFLAFAASLRSADLSRQVGAVVARDGEILSTGANDCPKAGGGLYWPYYNTETKRFEDFPNGRDSARGEDSNRVAQIRIISEILEECKKKEVAIEQITALRDILEDSAIGDLTEFGRVVHAEMEALLSCARKGLSPRKATVYCTTFPCHNCAKHIIAAGIQRVVFVEPYLKSQAKTLHDEIITIEYPKPADTAPIEESEVRFEPFFGVGPRRFFDLFSMNIGVGSVLKRKDKGTGDAVQWDTACAAPRVRMLAGSYLEAEGAAVKGFAAAVSAPNA